MSAPYPWQTAIWQDLQRRVREGNLPHALLFAGGRGTGKADFARQQANSLLCDNPDTSGKPCGQCHACGLLVAGSHPDLRVVEPAEEGKAILIDSIRALGEFLALKGQYGQRQIVIINPAEAMNRLAANSLLKTLEEPTPEALIILVSSKPSLLLPTIRSRCQQLAFSPPDTATGTAWLQEQVGKGVDGAALLALGDGAPLEALQLHETGGLGKRSTLAKLWVQVSEGREDPLKCAANWADLGLPRALHWLSSWTMDLIRLKSGGNSDVIMNTDLAPELRKLATRLDLKRLFGHLEQLTEYTRWAGGQINTQLALEDLMISWGRMGTTVAIKSGVKTRTQGTRG
ncbi:DNA polymerase III subunit delta' [Kaarinaea lacus]